MLSHYIAGRGPANLFLNLSAMPFVYIQIFYMSSILQKEDSHTCGMAARHGRLILRTQGVTGFRKRKRYASRYRRIQVREFRRKGEKLQSRTREFKLGK
jgi:hypothetical protein